jgi:hypothetical protein
MRQIVVNYQSPLQLYVLLNLRKTSKYFFTANRMRIHGKTEDRTPILIPMDNARICAVYEAVLPTLQMQ